MNHSAGLALTILVGMATWGQGQHRVTAEEILVAIDRGQAVEWRDAVIVGPLDFTTANPKPVTRRGNVWQRIFGWEGSTIEYPIEVPVRFRNCIFQDDVVGSVATGSAELRVAVFHREVSFHGCEFRGHSHFKYTKFLQAADFSDTAHHLEALFKYTEFGGAVDFARARFRTEANFKYVKFPGPVNFEDAMFEGPANFKYAHFPIRTVFDGAAFQELADFKYIKCGGSVSFANATFQRLANFKYAEFRTAPEFQRTDFSGPTDFKYTKVASRPWRLPG